MRLMNLVSITLMVYANTSSMEIKYKHKEKEKKQTKIELVKTCIPEALDSIQLHKFLDNITVNNFNSLIGLLKSSPKLKEQIKEYTLLERWKLCNHVKLDPQHQGLDRYLFFAQEAPRGKLYNVETGRIANEEIEFAKNRFDIKYYDLLDKNKEHTIHNEHDQQICTIRWVNNQFLISADVTGKLIIANFKNRECFEISGNSGIVTGIEIIQKDRLVTTSLDGQLRIWDLTEIKCINKVHLFQEEYSENNHYITIKKLNNDSIIIVKSVLATSRSDLLKDTFLSAFIWDCKKNQCLCSMRLDSYYLKILNSTFLVYQDSDQNVILFDIKQRCVKHVVNIDQELITCSLFNKTTLLIGTNDFIYVWDIQKGDITGKLTVSQPAHLIPISPNLFISCTRNGELKKWDIERKKCIKKYKINVSFQDGPDTIETDSITKIHFINKHILLLECTGLILFDLSNFSILHACQTNPFCSSPKKITPEGVDYINHRSELIAIKPLNIKDYLFYLWFINSYKKQCILNLATLIKHPLFRLQSSSLRKSIKGLTEEFITEQIK